MCEIYSLWCEVEVATCCKFQFVLVVRMDDQLCKVSLRLAKSAIKTKCACKKPLCVVFSKTGEKSRIQGSAAAMVDQIHSQMNRFNPNMNESLYLVAVLPSLPPSSLCVSKRHIGGIFHEALRGALWGMWTRCNRSSLGSLLHFEHGVVEVTSDTYHFHLHVKAEKGGVNSSWGQGIIKLGVAVFFSHRYGFLCLSGGTLYGYGRG